MKDKYPSFYSSVTSRFLDEVTAPADPDLTFDRPLETCRTERRPRRAAELSCVVDKRLTRGYSWSGRALMPTSKLLTVLLFMPQQLSLAVALPLLRPVTQRANVCVCV